jgi:cadmium resistance transport/sequestration family protein
MIKTIIAALITYVATSIDEIPVLFMLYTKAGNRGKGKTITIFYFIGPFILIALGLLGALGLELIPAKWIVGFAGLVPLVMGIKILIKGEDEEEEKAVNSMKKFKTLGIQVLVITLLLGADDLGVYMPLFTTLTGWEIFQMLLVFVLGTAALCVTSYQLTRIDKLTNIIEKYERYIIGIIFVAIGIFVMMECGTISKILNIF